MPACEPENLVQKALVGEATASSAILALVDRDSGRLNISEGQFVDFKEIVELTNERQVGELGKDILGFSNAGGGLILAGVDDQGMVVGHGLLDGRRVRTVVGVWIGTRVDYEIGNCSVTIGGQNRNVGFILVRKTSSISPSLLREDVELRPGILRKVRYLRGSLPYRQNDSTIVESTGPGVIDRARELGFSYVAFRTRSSFLLAEDRPGTRLYAHLNDTFVGREEELAELLSKFEDLRGRGVSIAGMGGIGKTELAIELVHKLHRQKRFARIYSGSAKRSLLTSAGVQEADPVFSDYPSFLRDLAAWLGLETAPAASDEELAEGCVAEIARHKRVLLFVDNLETIEDARVAAFLDSRLPANAWIVATSRFHRIRNYVFAKDLAGLDEGAAGRLLRHELKRQGLQELADLDIKQLRKVASALHCHPLAVRWFAWLCSRERSAWDQGPTQMPREDIESFCVAQTLQHLPEQAVRVLSAIAVMQASIDVTADCISRMAEVDPKDLELVLYQLECSGLMNIAADEESGRTTYGVSQLAVRPARDLAREKEWEGMFTANLRDFLQERGGALPGDPLLRFLVDFPPYKVASLLDYERNDLLARIDRVKSRSTGCEIELLHLEAELHRHLGRPQTADEKYQEAADRLIAAPAKLSRERYQSLLLEAATVAKQAVLNEARLKRAVMYLEKIRGYRAGALRVFGMLAEFTGILGEATKFEEYSKRVDELLLQAGPSTSDLQRQHALAAVERGREGLRVSSHRRMPRPS